MKPCKLLLSLILLLSSALSLAQNFYAAPQGKPANPGTKDQPWDIASALNGNQQISAGDTLYLLAGTYKRRPEALFDVRLAGTAEKPIHVGPAPDARARIDGGLSVQAPSAHLWIRDLEIFVSEPVPEKPISPGSHPEDLKRPWGGMHMHGGKNCKYINLVIHNCNQAISCWKGEIDPEIYGCIMYDNGWLGTDRGHGHCIYTQNDEGVKVISNCIMTCKYDGTYTMHAYGSSRAYVNNFLVEKSIFYDKGPFLIGGGKPSRNIRVIGNFLYNVSMRIGYTAPHNENCELRDNLIVNADLSIVRYKEVINEANIIINKGQNRPEQVKTAPPPTQHTPPRPKPATTALPPNRPNPTRPKPATIALLPNRYDQNRANLVIYNWQRAKTVQVKTAGFLRSGDEFKLMDPKNLFAAPVFEGKCQAGAIQVPTKAEFAVFVLLISG